MIRVSVGTDMNEKDCIFRRDMLYIIVPLLRYLQDSVINDNKKRSGGLQLDSQKRNTFMIWFIII